MLICDLVLLLVNFADAAIALHGWNRKRLEANRDGRWELAKIMGITVDEFWAPIHRRGSQFWEELPPLPWFNDLVALLNRASNNQWWIASAPAARVTSHIGKLRWIEKTLPMLVDRSFINQHKAALAKPGRYLIDDRPSNIEAFEQEGGTGILFPHKCNHLAEFADNPVPRLAESLRYHGLLTKEFHST